MSLSKPLHEYVPVQNYPTEISKHPDLYSTLADKPHLATNHAALAIALGLPTLDENPINMITGSRARSLRKIRQKPLRGLPGETT